MIELASWIDGAESRDVDVGDRGLQYGDGLFETVAAPGGAPRLLDAHLDRLERGCRALSIPTPDRVLLAEEIGRAARKAPNTIVKLIVTRGSALARGYGHTGKEVARRIVLAYAWPDGGRAFQAPARVDYTQMRLAEHPQLAGLKLLGRHDLVLARQEAQRRGWGDALLRAPDGRVICGSMSNLFVVLGGELVTPSLDRCGVAGVMRGAVVGIARESSIPVLERDLGAADLDEAEDAFLTNALWGAWPIGRLVGRPLVQGALSRRIQGLLTARLAGKG